MRDFITAAKEDAEVIDKIPFKVDGEEYFAYPPTESQIALVVAAQAGGYNKEDEQIAALVNFMFGLFDEETHYALKHRLLDRDDPFEFDDLTQIMEAIVEESTGNPTRPSSASTPSQARSGARSTANARKQVSTR